MNRKGGYRRRSRSKMSRGKNEKGKVFIKSFLQSLKVGDRVELSANPSYQKGIYHLRFYGKKGIVKSIRGRSYEVEIRDQNKYKSVVIHPAHLRKL